MLVLTRRIDESLMIGDTICVKILGIEGDKVKLGIDAPRDLTILRQELYQAVVAQDHLVEKLMTGPEPQTIQKLRELLASEVKPEDAGKNLPEPIVKPDEKKD